MIFGYQTIKKMINVTPVSVSATSQEYACSVVETLCQAYCLAQSVQPQATVNYSVASQKTSDSTTFVTIQAVGSISYQPKGEQCCRPQVKMFTETFDIIFKGTGTPTIAVSQGENDESPANVKCNGNVLAYNIVTDVTITATYPS